MSSQSILIFLTHLILLISPIVKSDSLHRTSVVNAIASDVAATDAIHHEADALNHAANVDATAGAVAAADADAAGFGHVPPPPHPGPIIPPVIPGVGAGFGINKNFNFNVAKGIGLLPFLSGILPGLGGVGGVIPTGPVGVDPGVLPADPGLLGGLAGLLPPGGYLGMPFGTSYVPQTWIGSALGAKGDLWFPVVIFLFAILGVWFVAKFLLSLIVPLVASKLLLAKGVLAAKHVLRSAEEEPLDNRQSILDSLTHTVTTALAEEKCLKLITCQSGNFMRNMAGQDRAAKVAEIVKGLNSTSEAMKVFQAAAENGQDCSLFSCWGEPQGPASPGTASASSNKTDAKVKLSDGIHKPLATNLPMKQHSHDPTDMMSNELDGGSSPNMSTASTASLLHKHPLLSAFM